MGEGFMKYAALVVSGAMIYIPSLIKIGSSIQKSKRGFTDTRTHRQHGDLISILLFLICFPYFEKMKVVL
jgi:hypothetical protein